MYFLIDERVENFKSYYRMRNPKPLLGFFVGSEYPLFRYEAAKNLPIDRALRPDDFDPELFAEDCERLFTLHEEYGGDFIWSASAFWGIPWVEAIIGMELYANHGTGSIYTKNSVGTSLADSLKPFNRQNKWVILAEKMLQAAAKKSNGRFPLATTRIRGISDILSAIYGEELFIFEVLDDSENIHKTAEKLTDILVDFSKLQLENIPDYHGGIGSFYYNMWVPSRTVWLQEDSTALLSPDLYVQHIKSHDEKIISALESCIMHQHPTGYIPYKQYLDMNLTALELHIDKGGPSAEELFPVHQAILSCKPLLIWGEIPLKDLDWIFNKLPPEGLAVACVVNNKKQAENIWKRYKN